MSIKNHYELLGITDSAKQARIDTAARVRINELKQALNILSDKNYLALERKVAAKKLGVEPDADQSVFEQAARTGIDEVNEAVAILNDPEKRKAFDEALKRERKQRQDAFHFQRKP
ncbi:MAG: hypothetical protein GY862_06390 [Gammaproteobacteria bacterium]|nr:hypothetical protein [Gammaproteobacteria bacterium]